MTEKKYKGILHISAMTESDQFQIKDEQKQELEKCVDKYLFPDHNAGGLQLDGSFDIDCESPKISFEGTKMVIEKLKAIYQEIDPSLMDIDITMWLHIEDFFSIEDAKPTMTYSVDCPEGKPGINRAFDGELSECETYFYEMPTPATDDMNSLIKVPADQIDFV